MSTAIARFRGALGARMGDCVGAAAAGVTLIGLSRGSEGPEGEVFTSAGWLMVAVGLAAVAAGRRKR